MPVRIRLEEGDALQSPCDVLVVKYAQDNYGVDYEVTRALEAQGIPPEKMRPSPGGFRFHESRGGVTANFVLFVGVDPLPLLDYEKIRAFASKSLRDLAGRLPDATTVAYTLHGPGYGLDEKESFDCLLAGLADALRSGDSPSGISEIHIIERNPGRKRRLDAFLSGDSPSQPQQEQGSPSERPAAKGSTLDFEEAALERLSEAVGDSDLKRRVFVAMPFSGAKEDHYHYGIQTAVNDAEMLCERIDESAFMGDVLDQIKSRIADAWVMIADLSGKNPNVFLEVGYAWGKGIPTILLADSPEGLTFDVQGQRCLIYSSIRDLQMKLSKELQVLAEGAGS